MPDVYELLRKYGAALVIPDSPKYPFRELELTADWTFVRFHHGTRGRNGNYSETEIAAWAERIDGWVARRDRRLRLLQQRLGGLRSQERDAAPELLGV